MMTIHEKLQDFIAFDQKYMLQSRRYQRADAPIPMAAPQRVHRNFKAGAQPPPLCSRREPPVVTVEMGHLGDQLAIINHLAT